MYLTIDSKIDFIIIYGTLVDNYSEKSNYSNILKNLKELRSRDHFRDLTNTERNIVQIIQADLNIFKNHIHDNYSHDNLRIKPSVYSDLDAIAELNRLLKSLTIEHKLIKLFYHLSMIKFKNNYDNFNENNNLNNPNAIENELVLFSKSLIPFTVLDINDLENQNSVDDFECFFAKYPSNIEMLNKYERNFKSGNLENYLKEKIDQTEKSIHHFIEGIIKEDELDVFKNVDVDFFSSKFYNYQKDEIMEYIKIYNCSATILTGYEDACDTTDLNVVVVSLDINSFVKSVAEFE